MDFTPLFSSFSVLWSSDGTRRQVVITCPGRSCREGLSTCPHLAACCQPQLWKMGQRAALDDLECCSVLRGFIILQTTGLTSRP